MDFVNRLCRSSWLSKACIRTGVSLACLLNIEEDRILQDSIHNPIQFSDIMRTTGLTLAALACFVGFSSAKPTTSKCTVTTTSTRVKTSTDYFATLTSTVDGGYVVIYADDLTPTSGTATATVLYVPKCYPPRILLTLRLRRYTTTTQPGATTTTYSMSCTQSIEFKIPLI